jgi:2-methylcitrate dehydratase PrpD
MNYTRTLANYAANLKFEDLPREVVEQAKLLTLHVIGVAIAGSQLKQGKDAIALAKKMGGDKRESTILSDGTKVSSVQAAFANGTLADVLDWEDCSWTGHPSAGAIPAALAVGEDIEASGREYITSVVAGYEVYQRIAMAIQPTRQYYQKHGWGLTTWQIYAAAIPAARLMKLDENKMAHAIGIAGTLTPITNRKVAVSRSDMYHYQHGLTARDGIVAALVAQSGINGLDDMLDGDIGYCNTMSDQCRWGWLTKGLGKDYLIMETLFKHWPVNMWVQQFIDLVDSIRKEEPIRVEDIVEIIVMPNFHKEASRMIFRPEGYSGIADAQFSIPYCIAVSLLDHKPGPNWFTEEKLKDPDVLDLASKVRAEGLDISPLDAFAVFQNGDYPMASVEIVARNGRRISKAVQFPKGHPKNRLSEEEFINRFTETASFALKTNQVERVLNTVLALQDVVDINEVTEPMQRS